MSAMTTSVPEPDLSDEAAGLAGSAGLSAAESALGAPFGKAEVKGPRIRTARFFLAVPATRVRLTSSGPENCKVEPGTVPAVAEDSMSGVISRPWRVSTETLPGSTKRRDLSWAVAGVAELRFLAARESQTGMRAIWPLPALTWVASSWSPTTCWLS